MAEPYLPDDPSLDKVTMKRPESIAPAILDQIEAALEPFAKCSDDWIDCLDNATGLVALRLGDVRTGVRADPFQGQEFTLGDLRRARDCLAHLRSAKDEPSEVEVAAGAKAIEGVWDDTKDDLSCMRSDYASRLSRSCLIAARKAREV